MHRAVVLPCLFAAGCTAATFSPFERQLPPRAPGPCAARILDRAPRDGRYVELGFCTVDVPRVRFFGVASVPSEKTKTDYTPRVVEKLRSCACDHGGNAVLVQPDRGDLPPSSEENRIKPHGIVLYIPPAKSTLQ